MLVTVFLFSCFPYLIFITPTPSDLQPAGVVLASLFIVCFLPWHLNMTHSIIWWITSMLLGIPLFYALLKFAFDPSFSIRSVASYSSLFIFFLIGTALKSQSRITVRLLFGVTLVWLVVGLVQKFMDPSFGYELIRSPRSSLHRGVVSLAAEPSFYSIQILMLLILSWLIKRKGQVGSNILLLIEGLLLFQIIYLSQSFFGILLVVVFLLIRLIAVLPTMFPLFASVFLICMYYTKDHIIALVWQYRLYGRVFDVLASMLNNPLRVVANDQSAGERAADIVIAAHSIWERPFLNPGYTIAYWREYIYSVEHLFPWLNHIAMGNRIMSGIGSAVFELGTIGICVALAFFMPFFTFKRKSVALAFFMPLAMLTAIQIALPLVGIVLGYVVSSKKEETHLKKSGV
jgi:hypothetical protein